MRIIVTHNRPKEEVKHAIGRSFDDLFKTATNLPLQLVPEQRSWTADQLRFSLLAKMGPLSTPIKGIIDVTDRDLTIDVDLGMFEKLFPAEKVRDALSNRIKGLLR